jgi:hypothetical protein
MTLSAGTGYNAVGREIFGFAPQINFSAGSTGDDRTAFDFTSPMQLYMCEMQPAINTAGMAANDILSFSLTGNSLPIFQAKFALAAASEPIQAQLPGIKFILPSRTILKAVFNMQSGTGMVGTATCMFRGVAFA